MDLQRQCDLALAVVYARIDAMVFEAHKELRALYLHHRRSMGQRHRHLLPVTPAIQLERALGEQPKEVRMRNLRAAIAMASITLAQTLAVEQREPTDEEIDALSLRNRIKIAQVKADIEGRPD
jgi:hypothetical protein